jgi:hypothetical protein
MKKWIMAATLFMGMCLLKGGAYGQSMGSSYKTALGVKFWPGAITVKHFIADNKALEGLAYFWDHGFRFTGLYEFHGNINGAPGLKWYAGPGFHMGTYSEGWYYHNNHDEYYYNSGDFSVGLDGVFGLDYKFKGAPINMSLDIQPFLEIPHHTYMDVWGGLAVRYTF